MISKSKQLSVRRQFELLSMNCSDLYHVQYSPASGKIVWTKCRWSELTTGIINVHIWVLAKFRHAFRRGVSGKQEGHTAIHAADGNICDFIPKSIYQSAISKKASFHIYSEIMKLDSLTRSGQSILPTFPWNTGTAIILKSEQAVLINQLDCADDSGIATIKKDIADA